MKSCNEKTIIQAEGLSRYYQAGGEVVKALDHVTFSVKRGGFTALVGTSGSGKSTLLNLVGTLDRPTAGDILIEGQSLAKATEQQRIMHRRERVGFIFQSFNLIPTLSAAENVEVPMMLTNVGKRQRKARALELLNRVHLSHRASHKPNQLSGGENQRVAIARAMANRPALLLADEPTGNLDSKTETAVLELLIELLTQDQVTMLLVTHDPQVAAHADQIIHLLDGQIERIESLSQKDAAVSTGDQQ
ncbi:MAG: ABC transporter ATP-binding protein [Phycisphaerae bacterium]|nr:ABC transporter ATP-binding protein [Phycisphaerae bacterium]